MRLPIPVFAFPSQILNRLPPVRNHLQLIGDLGHLESPLDQEDVVEIVFDQQNCKLLIDHSLSPNDPLTVNLLEPAQKCKKSRLTPSIPLLFGLNRPSRA